MARKPTPIHPSVTAMLARASGVPKTATEIANRGFDPIDVNFAAMNEAEASNWVSFSNPRPGTIALLRPPTGGALPKRYFPTGDRNVYIVCTYNPDEQKYNLDCHKVPASEISGLDD